MHVLAYKGTCRYLHVLMFMFLHTSHVYMCACVYTPACMRLHVPMYTCIRICMYTCMFVHMCICTGL